jgi:CheY-like chemotaxis protein/HPt (histidine-containing phosphotransfer) domain-containing protein
VPQDKHHLLFQPFSQADALTTRRYGGTGLGLSIIGRLVEMMGGQKGFESEEGKGSQFWFTATFQLQPGERPRPLLLAGHRVLVVDDNSASRKLLVELLGFWQCQAGQAGDAEGALALLRAPEGNAFEAVILDTDMPGSRWLIRQMVEDASLARTARVLLVALTETVDADCCRGPGFAARVIKPVKQAELGACLASALGHGPAPARSRAGPDCPRTNRETRARFRLLLVEDNPANQEVALGILSRLGYCADVVADGRFALLALSQKDYDLVLMDCQLPEMDGYEATRQIRQKDTAVRNHEIPIIAMTAHAMAGDREKCLAAGMNDYLSKPVRPGLLEQAIEKWTGGYTVESVVPAPAPAPLQASSETFDCEGLTDRLMGDDELARRVVARFLGDMPQQLAALSQAISSADGSAVRTAAHSIKGAAANVGGTQVRDAAWKLEQLGNAGELGPAASVLNDLSASFDRVRPLMERFSEADGDGMS